MMRSVLRSLVVAAGLAVAGSGLGGCTVVGHLTELRPDWYRVVRLGAADSLEQALMRSPRAYAQLVADTLLLTPYDPTARTPPPPARYVLQPGRRAVLLDRQFDIDVFTLPFKIRPPRAGVPVQLNSNFNAALYVGHRYDFLGLSADRRTAPWQQASAIKETGLGYGTFVGLGSTVIADDVTQGRAVHEYEGLVVNAGLAALYDARIFNLGLAVGVDFLAGPDRASWIYQHRPWFGVLFGLNLN